ncbi:MAG: hypothetical protein JNJ92_02040 [Altererythrobacter sp.]|nr:hypothetical protein [Altererythrobacter sp.]
MIGKVVGAFLGGKAAERVSGIQGPTGAALGVLAPMIIRRLSWPAMIAIGVGGYLAKKAFDDNANASRAPAKAARKSTRRKS